MDFENQDQLLRYLDIQDEDSITFETLNKFMDLLPSNKKIIKLKFSSMTLEGIEKLADILINQDMNIETLEIQRFKHFSIDEVLCKIIENNLTIKTLILTGIMMDSFDPVQSMLKNYKIHTLNLESEKFKF
jgi:hypothetical protein